jgi:hypothetical protein
MAKYYFIALLIFVNVSCRNNRVVDEKATEIVKRCIEAHGGNNYKQLDVSFDYRKFRIHLEQEDGHFLYERSTTDSLNNEVHDALTNDGFTRKINGTKQDLTKQESEKYQEGLNAIAYFVLLPSKLSESAVNLKYLGEINIGNNAYDKINVTFEKEDGGNDHQDEFCYWINKNTHTLDYLSYSNGGPRFRKAKERQKVDGIIFQDYENYEILDTTISTDQYDKAFMAGKAKLLSTIEQDNYSSK